MVKPTSSSQPISSPHATSRQIDRETPSGPRIWTRITQAVRPSSAGRSTTIGGRIGQLFHGRERETQAHTPPPPVRQETQALKLPVYRHWMAGHTPPLYKELTRQERMNRAQAAHGNPPAQAPVIRNAPASSAPVGPTPDVRGSQAAPQGREAPATPPGRPAGMASQIRQLFSSARFVLAPSLRRETPSQTVLPAGTTPGSTVRGHDQPVRERTSGEMMQMQLHRNQELDFEEAQALEQFRSSAQMQGTPTPPPTGSSGIVPGSTAGPALRFPVPTFAFLPPSQRGGMPLQRIDSVDTPPASPASEPNRPQGPSALETPAASPMEAGPASHEANAGSTQDVPPLRPAQASDVLPIDPMLRHMERMDTIQQGAMLLYPQAFRAGYAAAGVAPASANDAVAGQLPAVPTTMPSQSAAAQAFGLGQAHGATVGELQMPNATVAPMPPGIAPVAQTPQLPQIPQIPTAIQDPQMPQPQALLQPPVAPVVLPAPGMVPGVGGVGGAGGAIVNPIVVLQAPPIDAPIARTWNTPEIPVTPIAEPGMQVQDGRLPPGIVISTSFPPVSSPLTGAESPQQDPLVQRF